VGDSVLSIFSFGDLKSMPFRYGFDDKGRQWAMDMYGSVQRAMVLHIDVPGPHSCLAALLECGFHIISFDTFVSTAITPFFDARC
jgi:hypothetical protein